MSPFAKPNPWGRPSASEQLADFSERRRFQARVDLLNTNRDAERRTAERGLRRVGTRSELAAYARRVRREDDADDLRLRSIARRLSASHDTASLDRWWRSLGPVTRRNFLRSGLDLRETRREAELEARLADVERDIEARWPDAADELYAAPELP